MKYKIILLIFVLILSSLLIINPLGKISIFIYPYRIDLSLSVFTILLFIGYFIILSSWSFYKKISHFFREYNLKKINKLDKLIQTNLWTVYFDLILGRTIRAKNLAHDILKFSENISEILKKSKTSFDYVAENLHFYNGLAHFLLAKSEQNLYNHPARDFHAEQSILRFSKSNEKKYQILSNAIYISKTKWALANKNYDDAEHSIKFIQPHFQKKVTVLNLQWQTNLYNRQYQEALKIYRRLVKYKMLPLDPKLQIQQILFAIHSSKNVHELTVFWDSYLTPSDKKIPIVILTYTYYYFSYNRDHDKCFSYIKDLFFLWCDQTASLSDLELVWLIYAVDYHSQNVNLDTQWLSNIESLYKKYNRNKEITYLYATTCLHHQLWGKAKLILENFAHTTNFHPLLQKQIYVYLATLAKERQETTLCFDFMQKALFVQTAQYELDQFIQGSMSELSKDLLRITSK